MKRSTREWVRKAEADFRAAHKLSRGVDHLPDQCCFHCQQCAEKSLKALLEELGLTVLRTHVLKDVLALLVSQHPSLAVMRRGLTFLTRFAVETCYPGDSASHRQAASALRWAGTVRDACRKLLGLSLRPRRQSS